MKRYIVKVLTITAFLIIIVANFSWAVDFGTADDFVQYGHDHPGLSDEGVTNVGAEFTSIGNILKYIGAGILVGAMGYMGILYMISPPEKQAKLKQQLIGLVVSGFVIFAGYYIWKIIVTMFSEIFEFV